MMRVFMIAVLTLLWGGAASAADNYPDRPIKLIIPFAPGGTADPLARILADVIQKKTTATIVVESHPGAGGNIGSMEVAKSAPDGYTLLLGANNSFVINQFLYKNSAIDPERDFDLISILVDQPLVVYVKANFPAKNLSELLKYIKAHPGEINFASPGVGTAPHLAGELLSHLYGLKMVHIPYRGGAPAIEALLSGEVQLYIASLSVGKSFIGAGKLRGLAVTSPERIPSLPDVPTTKEAGAAQFMISNWWGLASPKGVNPATLEWIHRQFARALNDPTAKSRLQDLGFTINAGTAQEFAHRVRSESALYAGLIKSSHITAE